MISAEPTADPVSATRSLPVLARQSLPLLITSGALDFSFALFVMAVQAFLPDTLGSGDSAPGLALALYGITRVLLQYPGGLLARRLGAQRLIVLGTGGAALAFLVMTAATSVPQVYVLTVLAGACTSLVWPPVYLLAGDQTEEQRGTLLGLVTFCGLAGMGGGVVLGALLVDSVPARALIPVSAAALAVAAGAVVAMRAAPSPDPSPAGAGEGSTRRSGSTSSSGTRASILQPDHHDSSSPLPRSGGGVGGGGRHTLLTLIPALTLQAIGLSMLLPLLREYAHTRLGLEMPSLIVLGVPAGLLAVVTFIPAGRLADRIGRAPVVAVGAAAASAGVFILAGAESGALFALGAIPLAAGYAASAPALSAWIADLTDDAGGNVGLALTVQGVALAAGPALTGILIAEHGTPLPMRVAALLWLGAAVCAALSARRPRSNVLYHSPRGS